MRRIVDPSVFAGGPVRSGRGFSLSEILLALGLLSVLLVMAMGILQWALQGSQLRQAETRAAFLAQGKMEELFAQSTPVSDSGKWDESWRWSCDVIRTENDFLQLRVRADGPRGSSYTLQAQRRASPRAILFQEQDTRQWKQTDEDFLDVDQVGGPLGVEVGSSFSVSPDGKSVAYTSRYEGKNQIFLRDVEAATGKLLFDQPEGAENPCFSPDGSLIAFTSQESGFSQVFVFNRKSRLSENWSRGAYHDGSACWAPDGKSLVVSREGSSLIQLASGSSKMLVEDTGCWNAAPAFSPDGKTLAFMSNRDGNPEIYTITSGKLKRLTENPAYDTCPQFSKDGRRILFFLHPGRRRQSSFFHECGRHPGQSSRSGEPCRQRCLASLNKTQR